MKGGHIAGVHHIAINVSDWERSGRFYRDVLGFEQLFEPGEGAGEELEEATRVPGARLRFAMFRVGDDCVELIQYLSPEGRPYDRRNCDVGNMHLAFRVPDMDEAYAELQDRGVKFNSPPIHIGEGPLEGCAFSYFTDPDGVTLEIFQEAKSE